MTLLVQYTLIFASVLLLVALGGCFAERSGIINIGLEGIMVVGALGGALVMKFLPVTVGAPVMVLTTILASALFGLVFSLLLAVAAINFKADQTITGTALIIDPDSNLAKAYDVSLSELTKRLNK